MNQFWLKVIDYACTPLVRTWFIVHVYAVARVFSETDGVLRCFKLVVGALLYSLLGCFGWLSKKVHPQDSESTLASSISVAQTVQNMFRYI